MARPPHATGLSTDRIRQHGQHLPFAVRVGFAAIRSDCARDPRAIAFNKETIRQYTRRPIISQDQTASTCVVFCIHKNNASISDFIVKRHYFLHQNGDLELVQSAESRLHGCRWAGRDGATRNSRGSPAADRDHRHPLAYRREADSAEGVWGYRLEAASDPCVRVSGERSSTVGWIGLTACIGVSRPIGEILNEAVPLSPLAESADRTPLADVAARWRTVFRWRPR